MRVYYNEFDPFAAAWLRELMADGLIPAGDVDERSIVDVQPQDLTGYDQCHFFAGIGGWAEALRLAGWGDRPVWTGSCPCQPFSVAGKRKGSDDERHLWPAWFRLIDAIRPPVIFGEQVASKDALGWLDGVFADLENADYACGAADLCAAGVGAPHIRQRLYWVADAASSSGPKQFPESRRAPRRGPQATDAAERRGFDCGPAIGRLADSGCQQRERRPAEQRSNMSCQAQRAQESVDDKRRGATGRLGDDPSGRRGVGGAGSESAALGSMPVRVRELLVQHPPDARARLRVSTDRGVGDGPVLAADGCGLGDTNINGREGWLSGGADSARETMHGQARHYGATHWSDTRIIHCRDGKARRVPTQSGFQFVADGLSADVDGLRIACEDRFPLAGKIPNRTGLLKGAGNAIVPQVAAEFVMAFMEARQ